MGVKFAPDVRRLIVAATTLGEARGAGRPRIRDLTDALASQRETLPPIPVARLNDDLEEVLGAASALAGQDEVTLGMLIKALAGLSKQGSAGSASSAPSAASVQKKTAVSHPRVGIGYDSHRFAPGGPMRLGGIDIDGDVHCAGHSDGDAICHALTDAILGAANAGDIGEMFPDTDPANRGRDSLEMLRAATARIAAAGFRVANADVTVIAEKPKIGPHRDAMRQALSGALRIGANDVSLKGKTNEGMDATGRGEGLAVIAVAMLLPAQG